MWEIMPESASTFAGDIDYIIELITYTVGIWLIATYMIFFALLVVFRRRKDRPAQYVTGNGKQMAWVLVPVFLVALCDFAIDIENAPIWTNIKEEIPVTDQAVRVVGRQWMWVFSYPGADGMLNTEDDVQTVNQLHVKVNAKTLFELTAADVLHSFSIPAFRLKQDAIPGRLISGWFEATKIGSYDIQCTEICGLGHTVMAARVIVHSAQEFDGVMSALAEARQTEQLTAQVDGSVLPREN